LRSYALARRKEIDIVGTVPRTILSGAFGKRALLSFLSLEMPLGRRGNLIFPVPRWRGIKGVEILCFNLFTCFLPRRFASPPPKGDNHSASRGIRSEFERSRWTISPLKLYTASIPKDNEAARKRLRRRILTYVEEADDAANKISRRKWTVSPVKTKALSSDPLNSAQLKQRPTTTRNMAQVRSSLFDSTVSFTTCALY